MEKEAALLPRLLLVEDDPISQSFLCTALQALPAQVLTAASIAEALAAEGGFDLWLIDAHLPDGDGAELLRQLRQRQPQTPAMAHTADPSPAQRARLRAAGFADALVKPLAAETLQTAVRELLSSSDGPAVWNDAAALSALNGNIAGMDSLRRLFLDELPTQLKAIEAALQAGDHAALHRELHRLKASSGFVGAARLQAAIAALDATPHDEPARQAFREALRLTLAG
ncbi:response regulator [Pseudoxanthomonas kalamensis DSM 18571]|uniref:Hpt domain-containing response regulator n=1 Tax=Pseudoxanthomonas kalamensis TaxID=289483 RepID=UPI001B877543|nr:response regulator [Pseudoxanthomonas kalamensis]KAF1709883.1 response regulator [Pseudoxanthomonas kalamensis DSM 18571]